MRRYLLATQTLFDIAKPGNLPSRRWFELAASRDVLITHIHISAVSPMGVMQQLDREPAGPSVDALREAMHRLVKRFEMAERIVSVNKRIADRWGKLLDYELKYRRSDGGEGLFSDREKLVMATALEGDDLAIPFVLVARRQPAHDALGDLGLTIEDPHELYP